LRKLAIEEPHKGGVESVIQAFRVTLYSLNAINSKNSRKPEKVG
jgi:hypothetical protein